MPSNSKKKSKKRSTCLLTPVKDAITLLTAAMLDPLNANVCGVRMARAAVRIDEEIEAFKLPGDKSKFARSQPALLRAGIKFLTTKHTPGNDFQTFLDAVNHCEHGCIDDTCTGEPGRARRAPANAVIPVRAPRTPPGSHIVVRDYRCSLQLYDSKSAVLVIDATNTIFRLLELALMDLTRHNFRRSSTDDGVLNWPQGPEDLFPSGIETALCALQLWINTPPFNPYGLQFLGALACFHAPFSDLLVWGAGPIMCFLHPREHLEHILADYRSIQRQRRAQVVCLSENTIAHFKSIISAVFGFYSYLQRSEPGHFPTMVHKQADTLYPVLSDIQNLLDSPSMSTTADMTKTSDFVLRMVMYAMPEEVLRTHDNPAAASMGFSGIRLGMQNWGLDRTLAIMQTTRTTGCFNVSCKKFSAVGDMSDSAVSYAKRCGKCDLVRFCSESCIKEAWNSPFRPHKKVCGAIYRFKEMIGTENWALISNSFTGSDLEDICTRYSIDANHIRQEIGDPLNAIHLHIKMGRTMQGVLNMEGFNKSQPTGMNRAQIAALMQDGNEMQVEEMCKVLKGLADYKGAEVLQKDSTSSGDGLNATEFIESMLHITEMQHKGQ